jgi:1-acylglycerone phosphate reductase
MTILSLDVTQPESVKAAGIEVERLTEGMLDVLVNNA